MEFSTNETRIVPLPTSGDVLTEVLRQGAKKLLSQAIEAEVAEWIERHREHQDDQGRQQVVRNGFLPRADHPHGHRARGREATARA